MFQLVIHYAFQVMNIDRSSVMNMASKDWNINTAALVYYLGIDVCALYSETQHNQSGNVNPQLFAL